MINQLPIFLKGRSILVILQGKVYLWSWVEKWEDPIEFNEDGDLKKLILDSYNYIKVKISDMLGLWIKIKTNNLCYILYVLDATYPIVIVEGWTVTSI